MGCTAAKGIVVDEQTKSEKAIKAAVLIQKWYRRYLARAEARRRCTWHIFQSIEYSGEQTQLKLYNFFNNMLSQMDPDDKGQPRILRALSVSHRPAISDLNSLEKEDNGLFCMSNPDDVIVESNYKGVHLSFPLTHIQLQSLIKSFKSKQTLHAKYLLKLLHETRSALKQIANVQHATTSIAKQITVCGDLHGKLDDLYMIFHKNGLPSVDNPYIFNGDFVDRGRHSVEIIIILFSCFLINRNEVYLNRGNHEDHVMNIRYGFVREISKKYPGHATKLLRLLEDVFSWLPIATVIDHKILVLHGGISDTVNLGFLAKIDRHKVLDILWSDPRVQNGCQDNTFRGGGCYFGPDVTELFLDHHGMKRIIRSHECKPDGYEFTHNNKVLTIFSASNYYEEGSNKGAYVKLHGPDLEYHIVQYMSSKVVSRKVTFAQRVTHVESSAITSLREKLLGLKTELMNEFKRYDKDCSGRITHQDWCDAMEKVMEMELPWRTLRTKLTRSDYDGKVLYETTFEEMRLYHRYSGNGPTITEMLYRQKDNLETVFRILDRDNSGYISIEEFEEVIALLTRQEDLNIPSDQVKDIALSIDLNNDGKIDFNEFLEAFRIVDQCGKEQITRDVPSVNSLVSIDSVYIRRNSTAMGMKRKQSSLLGDIREVT